MQNKKPGKKFKPALDYSNRSSLLLFSKLKIQNEALEIICASLPQSIAEQISCCVINDNRIILYCESAAWASQLRFHHPLLRSVIREQISPVIEAIQIKVFIAPKNKPTLKTKRNKTVDTEVLSCLRNNAMSTQHEPLKSALLRLEATLKKT